MLSRDALFIGRRGLGVGARGGPNFNASAPVRQLLWRWRGARIEKFVGDYECFEGAARACFSDRRMSPFVLWGELLLSWWSGNGWWRIDSGVWQWDGSLWFCLEVGWNIFFCDVVLMRCLVWSYMSLYCVINEIDMILLELIHVIEIQLATACFIHTSGSIFWIFLIKR